VKQIREHVAGLDVHRDTVVACIWVPDAGHEVTVSKATFSTTSKGLRELSEFLTKGSVRTVAMEATGVYWKPVYQALEGSFEEIYVCNAQHVKNVPGRKSDLADAEWLADVAAHGMVRPSLVPPQHIRELRQLTRYRKTKVDARAHELLRLDKVLQDAGIKLTSVASRVWSVSSRRMIEAMIAGERDPKVLAEMALGRMRSKSAALEEALDGHFGAHHACICRQVLDTLDFLDKYIASLTADIAIRLAPYENELTILCSIPGVERATAEVIIAETGGDMSKFPTAGHLCAWAGLAPANNESAGKHKPAGTRKGSPWLRRTLIEAARAAAHKKGSYFQAKYIRTARRRGPNKAAVAVAHAILRTVWHLLTTGQLFEDPGADFYVKKQRPETEAKRLASRLRALGYEIELPARTS
jgi:transposase